MSLEDQFSLAKGGGVYYTGTKVTPTEDPVLFIGLGGTGIDALLRVKIEVQSRMEPLREERSGRILRPVPGNMAFLAVDTDRKILDKAVGVATIRETEDEYMGISVDGLPTVIASIVSRHIHDPEWDWFDPELTAAGGIDGANGVRQIGRLMLMHNFTKVKNQLNAVLTSIVSYAQNKSNNLKVFVLTGVGGGTGSGTFLDMAYLARKVGKELTPNVQVHSYIFTPDLNKTKGGDQTSMYRNGFTALKELDYWMSMDEHGQHFIQRYPGGVVIDSTDRPFDYCHIITRQDAKHKILDYDSAMVKVANALFAYLASEFSGDDSEGVGGGGGNIALTSMYDNINAHINAHITDARYPANYKYLSVGASAIEIPYRQIMTLIAAKMFSALKPVFNRAPSDQSFNQDLMSLRLTYNHLWSDIQKDISGDPTTTNYSYRQIVPNNVPYQKTVQWLNGLAYPAMAKNGANLAANKERVFADYIKNVMKNPDRGPGYASRLIESNSSSQLINTLESWRQDCNDHASTAAAKESIVKNRLVQAFEAVKGSNLFTRNAAVEEYNAALKDWKTTNYCFWAYTELSNGMLTLINRLKKYQERIFHPLLSALIALPLIFEDNYKKIREDDGEALKHPAIRNRYLILATEFAKQHEQELNQRVDVVSKEFLKKLEANLNRWVGITIGDIDESVMNPADVGGFVSEFVNDNFSEIVNMNLETLLLQNMPVGTMPSDYIQLKLNDLKQEAIAMFHLDVGQGLAVSPRDFSLISIPRNCQKIMLQAKNHHSRNQDDSPRMTMELSKLQWIKVMAGMPLYAFPEINEMEQIYENQMSTASTRRGVHLRYEWREKMPNPLPEESWPDSLRGSQQKIYTEERNNKVRKAYECCCDAGIIQEDQANHCERLFQADEQLLDSLFLYGNVAQKRQQLAALKQKLWSDESTAVTLPAFGAIGSGTLRKNVGENALRFYNKCEAILNQQRIFNRFSLLESKYQNVEYYVRAVFCGLIVRRGFNRLLLRSKSDPNPIKIADTMAQSAFPKYDEFNTFCTSLATEANLRANIDVQFETARKQLIAQDGSFIESLVAEKRDILSKLRADLISDMEAVEHQLNDTLLEQRKPLEATHDFFELAVETVDGLLKQFS